MKLGSRSPRDDLVNFNSAGARLPISGSVARVPLGPSFTNCTSTPLIMMQLGCRWLDPGEVEFPDVLLVAESLPERS
jgi:hypothetical protein